MLCLDAELQRLRLFELAKEGNVKALQRCRASREFPEAAWDALITIQAARANDWALLNWALQEGLPTVLGFSESRSISDRESVTAREALYYRQTGEPTLPVRTNYLLPSMRAAFAKRAAADAEALRQERRRGRSDDVVFTRPIPPEEYVFMEPDAATAAFLQGHLDMMHWLLNRAGGIKPGHTLFRYGVIQLAMAVPAPMHSILWILSQGTHHVDYLFPVFVVEALVMAASFKRYDYLRTLGLHYCNGLDAERKAQVLWHLSSRGRHEALQVLLALPAWRDQTVPDWPLSDEEEEEEEEEDGNRWVQINTSL